MEGYYGTNGWEEDAEDETDLEGLSENCCLHFFALRICVEHKCVLPT